MTGCDEVIKTLAAEVVTHKEREAEAKVSVCTGAYCMCIMYSMYLYVRMCEVCTIICV